MDLSSAGSKLARNRLRGHVPQQDLTNNMMHQKGTSGELRVSSVEVSMLSSVRLRITSMLPGLGRIPGPEGSRRASPFVRSCQGDLSSGEAGERSRMPDDANNGLEKCRFVLCNLDQTPFTPLRYGHFVRGSLKT